MSTVEFTRSLSLQLTGLPVRRSKAEDFAGLCIEQGIEQGLAYLKEQWKQGKHPLPRSFEPLVSNPKNYLATWSATHAVNASSQAITDVQDRECVSLAFSTGATLLGLLDGMTAVAGLQRYQHAQAALKSSLAQLAQALTDKSLTPLELANIKATCAKSIQAAMGLTGMQELITQILADGVMAMHGAVNKAAEMALLAQVLEEADGLSQMCEDPAVAHRLMDARKLGQLEQMLYPDGRDSAPFIPQLKSGVTSEQFLKQVKVQEDNFDEQSTWLKENTWFGLGINVVSFARSLYELLRFKGTRDFLKEKKNAMASGLEKLQGLPGVKMLTHLFHATCFRIKSNSAALTGAVARLLNAIGGGIIKGLVLGGVAVGPAGTVLSALVVGVYALKAYVQRYYDRLAGHNENEVANAFRMAAHMSPEELEVAIAKELVRDLQALAGDMNHIEAFLGAMGHPELFDDFKAKFEAAGADPVAGKKKQMALLKSLVDACMPTSDGCMKKQAMASGDARVQLAGHLMPEPPAPKGVSKFHPEALSRSKGATWAEKFNRNLLDKAIASLLGEYPGWHMKMGYSRQVSIEAEKHLALACGDTPATQKLIALAHALGANKALVTNRAFFHAFLKGRTWALTPQGKDIEQALESGDPQSVKGSTLASALSRSDHDLNNHHLIAGCRFDETTHAEDHAHLVTQLKSVRQEKSQAHLITLVEALETGKGQPVLDLARKMQKTEAGKAQFRRLFETACMLIAPPRSAPHAAATCAALFEGGNLATLSGDDLSHALAIVTRQQLHARIGDSGLREALANFLTDEGSAVTRAGDMVFVKSPKSDARWDLYAKDVIAGKAPLAHAPDWLLPKEFKALLEGRKLGKACEAALREQFQIGLDHAPDAPQPFSLRWPSTVLGKDTATLQGLWQRSFAPLAGVDVRGRERTWPELKAAAALYARCQQGVFGLSHLEKLIKAHKKDASPEQLLTLQVALRWIGAPWSVRVDDQATVKALMATRNSKAFIQLLKDKVNPPPTMKKLNDGGNEETVGNGLEDTIEIDRDRIQELNAYFNESLSFSPNIRDDEGAENRFKKKPASKRRLSLHIPVDTRGKLHASTAHRASTISIGPRMPSRIVGDTPLVDPDGDASIRRGEATRPLKPLNDSAHEEAVGAVDANTREHPKKPEVIPELNDHFHEALPFSPAIRDDEGAEIRFKNKPASKRRLSLHIPSDTQGKLHARTVDMASMISIARRQPPMPSRIGGDTPLADPDGDASTRRDEATHPLKPFDEALAQHRLLMRADAAATA